MIASPITPATSAVEKPSAPLGAADALTDLREHVREHEDEQQRLEQRAGQELLDVLAQHHEVAEQQRAERGARRGGRACASGTRLAIGLETVGDGRHSRRSFPVRLMNTVSSVGSVADRSRDREAVLLGDVDDRGQHAVRSA